MDTSSVKVELPDPLGSFVAARVRAGDFADASAYLQDLVRRDREAQVGRLAVLIQEGLDSGEPTPLTEDEIAAIRQRIRTR
jgi:putative addiction module CopG family antidote